MKLTHENVSWFSEQAFRECFARAAGGAGNGPSITCPIARVIEWGSNKSRIEQMFEAKLNPHIPTETIVSRSKNPTRATAVLANMPTIEAVRSLLCGTAVGHLAFRRVPGRRPSLAAPAVTRLPEL